MNPLKILLIDDSEDDVILYRKACESNERLSVSGSLSESTRALDYLQSLSEEMRPDLIFLDINMPVVNGFEVLENLRRDESLRTIPVVMLSTSQRESDIKQSYALGATSYIAKPSGFSDVKKMLNIFADYWSLCLRDR